ncbi:hypothetical protein TNCT_672601 [Trichonephila clavata]|uniref:Uncharacterized protein n=1 Tax=Trichonephila clavata TaxID=2740835 RepID=A0A8X6K8W2_TRICU|nr:hypothetical protein TNCT_672601 [Trichonephila clavata]
MQKRIGQKDKKDASELTDENEEKENEVNTGEIIVNDSSWAFEGQDYKDSFLPEPPTSSSVSTTNNRKKVKRHQPFWIKNKSYHHTQWETNAESLSCNLFKQIETTRKDKTSSDLFEQFYSSKVYNLTVK